MGFKCGIVGLPNVGKSTLFNALTKAEIEAANYPFCTIEPNVGVVPVPDGRLNQLAEIVEPKKILPTTMEFVDIAGLVEGASQGEGLGNQFLGHIRETEAIAQVVRCFIDDDVTHVAGTIDPEADIDVIQTELLLADMETVDKSVRRLERVVKGGDEESKRLLAVLLKLKPHLDEGRPARSLELDAAERKRLATLHLLTAKPTLFVANVDEAGLSGNDLVDVVRARAEREGARMIVLCAALEAEIAELDDDDRDEFLEDLGLEEPGLDRLIHAGYELLGLQTFFTAGPKEVRGWTVRSGAKAPEAAGRIHSDFERGFIRAEVIGFDDFIECRGEHGAKEVGKLRIEGKEYPMSEGDVVHFRFNV